MKLIIRSYRQKDVEDLIEVWYESTITAHDFIPEEKWRSHKEDLRLKYLPVAETWVAEMNGELVGFISLLDDYIGALFVKPSWQGKSVGSNLLNHVMEIKNILNVGVYKKNEKARCFYEKHGFKYVNEEKQKETGEIVQNMTKKIK